MIRTNKIKFIDYLLYLFVLLDSRTACNAMTFDTTLKLKEVSVHVPKSIKTCIFYFKLVLLWRIRILSKADILAKY